MMMMKNKYVVATLRQRQRRAADQLGQERRHPLGPLLLGRDVPSLQADPEAYLGVVDSMYVKPEQVMLVARA